MQNNDNTPFDFTEDNYKKVYEILSHYPSNYKKSAIIPLLHVAQYQNSGWIPLSAMNKIAKIVEVAPIRVYEVASFYTMFNRQPVGKYLIQLCGTTPCMLCGAEDILGAIEKHLGIHVGQTTEDELFTLMEVECLGACSNAPMIQINDDFYEDLTTETTVKLLKDLAAGAPVKVGPQTHRKTCEGPLTGKQTLLGGEKQMFFYAKNLDKAPTVADPVKK